MNIKWNANDYTDHFAFVHQYGEDVAALVDAEHGFRFAGRKAGVSF